jgi:hypothetical protein
MSIFKYAEAHIDPRDIEQLDVMNSNQSFTNLLINSKVAKSDENIKQRFIKFAQELKKIAPRAKDFLYFSCIMMHAAEAALIDKNTGEIIRKNGEEVTSKWEINKATGSWKWNCSDSSIRPYRNNNGDIFPESELKKAFRKWIGRPLCKDHQSGSVDGIRGIIVDTYYDDKRKRVIALCALDKVNYPDLARKVSTGYATNVSMGTAVGISICFDCGNVARIESEYCQCVKGKATYGEINIDLSPIELSLVVTGADPGAQLRNVIASLNTYSSEKHERIEELKRAGCVTPNELDSLRKEVLDLKNTIKFAVSKVSTADLIPSLDEATRINTLLQNPTLSDKARKNLQDTLESLLAGNKEEEVADVEEGVEVEPVSATQSSKVMSDTGKGYVGQSNDTGPPQWSMEGERLASLKLGTQVNNINDKLDAMEFALRDMAKCVQKDTKHKEEQSMSDKELRERAAARRAMFRKNAYHQGGGGVNDPQTYPVDPLNDQLKTKGDKQMEGQGMEPGSDGLHPGYESFGQSEESLKKMLSRAELDQRRTHRHAFVKGAQEDIGEKGERVQIGGATYLAGKSKDGKPILLQMNEDGKTYSLVDDAAVQNATDLIQAAKACGFNKKKKEAYWQGGGGVNEPQTYSVDPLNDKLKTDGDKQMEGQGMESGSDGLHPGYQSYGNELALKQKLLRAKLRAKFVVAYKNEDKTVIDKENSRWEIYAGPEKILEASGKEIYEDELENNWEVLASKKWGREVLRACREEGIDKVAWYLKGDGIAKEAQPPVPPEVPGADIAGAPPPVGGPMPGAEEEVPPDAPEEDIQKEEDPVKAALESASEHLEEVEKSLGDIEKAYEEASGQKGESAELDTSGISEADDGVTSQYGELHAGLDESADELAMLAESLDSRIKTEQGANDPITQELIRFTDEAVVASKELCNKASIIVEAAKKGKKKEDDENDEGDIGDIKEEKNGKKKSKQDEKEDGKKKSKKEDKKESKQDEKENGKKKSKKEDKKESKKEDNGEENGENDKKDKKKKTKAERIFESLLDARVADRRNRVVRQAQEGDLSREDVERMITEALESKFGPLGEGGEEDVEEGGGEEFESEVALDVGEGIDDEIGGEEEYDMGALDAELSQMLNDMEIADVDDSEEGFAAEDLNLEAQAAARRAWREKVAAGVNAKYQLSLDSQVTSDTDMPLGKSHSLEGLDTKTPESTVEGIVEVHEEILKQVHNLPQVREAVNHIGNLLKSGTLKIEDLENEGKLKALAVDPAAASYWKGYFGQGDQKSKEFGNELSKEYSKKKSQASLDEQKIKMRRAYDIALSMQEKGLIPDSVASIHNQVDEIMQFDNKSFESFKRALSRVSKPTGIKTTASPALNVGIGSENIGDDIADSSQSLASQIQKLWD